MKTRLVSGFLLCVTIDTIPCCFTLNCQGANESVGDKEVEVIPGEVDSCYTPIMFRLL